MDGVINYALKGRNIPICHGFKKQSWRDGGTTVSHAKNEKKLTG